MSKNWKKIRKQKDKFFGEHPQSPLPPEILETFQGLAYYAPDPKMVFDVEAEEYDEKTSLMIPTTTNDERRFLRWGKVTLDINGQTASLTLFYSPENDYFFLPFLDATNGEETYKAGRYLDPPRGADGRFHIDFNLAYSPYCAYSPYYSCVIPPEENCLEIAIHAGEKLLKTN